MDNSEDKRDALLKLCKEALEKINNGVRFDVQFIDDALKQLEEAGVK